MDNFFYPILHNNTGDKMKKIIITLICLIIPLNVFAYSDYIIPGGQTLGIEVNNNGVIVIGFYRVNGKINKNDLKVGDIITKVNNIEIEDIENMINLIEQNIKDDKVSVTIKRDNKTIEKELTIEKVNGIYKTGLYVKDSIMGIGTLSYIDPTTKIYGALGHEIIESTTNKLIEVKTGSIFKTSITSIDKSVNGIAGTKNAKFYNNINYGTVTKNTNKGIYGIYTSDISNTETLKVGKYEDITLGKAYIKTVISGEEIKQYEIEIDRINNNDTKNIHFKIISEDLINKTGGIVQGMSGSPIIQNNKIIGAVTHVVVDNPSTGYGILITKMLEEGEKSLEN